MSSAIPFHRALHLHLPLAAEVGNAGGEGHTGAPTGRAAAAYGWCGCMWTSTTPRRRLLPHIARALVAGAVPTRHIPMLGGLRLSAAAAAPARPFELTRPPNALDLSAFTASRSAAASSSAPRGGIIEINGSGTPPPPRTAMNATTAAAAQQQQQQQKAQKAQKAQTKLRQQAEVAVPGATQARPRGLPPLLLLLLRRSTQAAIKGAGILLVQPGDGDGASWCVGELIHGRIEGCEASRHERQARGPGLVHCRVGLLGGGRRIAPTRLGAARVRREQVQAAVVGEHAGGPLRRVA